MNQLTAWPFSLPVIKPAKQELSAEILGLKTVQSDCAGILNNPSGNLNKFKK
jgi:hypothetical protein